MTSAATTWRRIPSLVVAVVVLVGAYDVAIGAFMLLSDQPWLAHGPATPWLTVPESPATLSLFRRMGAFSLHAGVVTVVWALHARRQPRGLTALFLTYLCTGMGFFYTDQTFFQGTPYLQAKGLIGTAFFLAFLLHLGWLWHERRGEASTAH